MESEIHDVGRGILGDNHALAARIEVAQALRRLGHALVGHRVDEATVRRITDFVHEIIPVVEAAPQRSRLEEIASSARLREALERSTSGPLLEEGIEMDLFVDSVVSGTANPMGVALRVRREGDEAVGRVTLGPAFEGAPGRAHGGIVSAIVDETMGALFPLLRTIAYTGRLTITYKAPAPIRTELEFRARLAGRDGRKLTVECYGQADGTRFVEAEGLFIEIDLARFAGLLDDDAS